MNGGPTPPFGAPIAPSLHASASPREDAQPPGWLRRRIIEGSLWLVALRWALRGLSLIRTVTLARLLGPADFGVFSMTMLVIRGVEVPTSLDLDVALVRREDASRRHFDAAWTLRALHRVAVTIILWLAAPLAGRYFNDARIATTVRVAAFAGLVWAFENIGIVHFRKQLDLAKEFGLSSVTTVVALATTIIGALFLRSYWALIIGFMVERVVWVLGSYVAHPYRPRPGWAAARELWTFSQWAPLQNTGRLLRNTLDSFLVGRFFGAAQMGIYAMAGSAAGLANVEIVLPVTGVLLPGYAKLAHDPERLARAYVDSLGMIATLLIGSEVGMAMIAPTFFPAVLGPRWLPAVPAAQWLALYTCFAGLGASVNNVLVVLGRMRRLSALIYAQLAVYAPILLLAAWRLDPVGLAAAKAATAACIAPPLFAALIVVSSVTTRQIIGALWRPTLASLVMAGAIQVVRWSWRDVSMAALAVQIAAGAGAFLMTTALLWVMSGRPLGAEHAVLDWMTNRLTPRRS